MLVPGYLLPAKRLVPAMFRPGIAHIVGLSTDEQVVGTDTGRVIAAVQHVEAVRDGAVVKFPGEAMCLLWANAGTKAESSVPLDPAGASPFPTTIRVAVYPGPEAVFK